MDEKGALESLVHIAVVGALLNLGYLDNLKKVMPMEQQELKYH